MISVAYIKGKYFICPNTESEDYSKRSWNNISRMKMNKHGFNGVMLKRGQVLKFGRYVFKINEISTDPNPEVYNMVENTEIDLEPGSSIKMNQLKTNDDQQADPKFLDTDDGPNMEKNHKKTKLNTISEEANKEIVCRICLSEDISDKEDPMISPCKCSGTMKYIHLQCLTEWLESKKTTKDGVHFRSFLWEHII